MATSFRPFFSKRPMISPTMARWMASGFKSTTVCCMTPLDYHGRCSYHKCNHLHVSHLILDTRYSNCDPEVSPSFCSALPQRRPAQGAFNFDCGTFYLCPGFGYIRI